MAKTDLQKLTRAELLELLIEQTKRADELEAQLAEARAQLQSREIAINEAGSIANAALKINGVLTAAEDAASQYLENIKLHTSQQQEICQKIEADARQHASEIIRHTELKCGEIERKVTDYWNSVSQRIDTMYQEYTALHEIFQTDTKDMKHAKQESEVSGAARTANGTGKRKV